MYSIYKRYVSKMYRPISSTTAKIDDINKKLCFSKENLFLYSAEILGKKWAPLKVVKAVRDKIVFRINSVFLWEIKIFLINDRP